MNLSWWRVGQGTPFFAALLIGCAAKGPTAPGVGDSLVFHIEPSSFIMSPGDSIQLRAVSDSGAEVPVLWRVVDTASGSITPQGLFSLCFSGGSHEVLALAHADTTKVARVTPALYLTLPLSIQAIRNASSQAPVVLDSVTDSLVVEVNVNTRGLACRHIVQAHLQALALDGSVTELVAVTYQTPPRDNFTEQLPWNSHRLANGTYSLRATVALDRYGPAMSNEINIKVRNP